MLQMLNALHGQQNVIECAYVKSNAVPGVDYFSTPIVLGVRYIQR